MKDDFSIFSNDPLNRLLGHVGLTDCGLPRNGPRLAVIFLVTWAPLALLSWLQDVAIGADARRSFLFDFAAYGQLFIALPMLVLAEERVERELRLAVSYLRESGIVPNEGGATLQRLIRKATQCKQQRAADIAAMVIAIGCTWVWVHAELSDGVASWHSFVTPTGERLTYAGWWAATVSSPVFVYAIARWA